MKAFMKLKKSLCMLLAVGLLCAVLPIAAQAAGCGCGEIPRIDIPGIGDTLVLNAGTPGEADVDVVDTGALIGQIWPILKDIACALLLRSWNRAADAFVKLAWGMLGHLQIDEFGRSVLPITGKPSDDPETKDHEENQMYKFRYDWRGDPWQAAAELDAYIQEVKLATGHSQVALLAHSEGNLVAMAYFARFEYDDVHSYIAGNSAHNGLTLVGELFNRNVELNSGLTLELMRSFGKAGGGGAMDIMAPAADLLQTTGIAKWLIRLLSVLLDNVQDRVFEEALIPLLVQWPALWGFVPHEYYESARADLLSSGKHEDFANIIDNMHNNAGAGYKADELIQKAVDAGVRVSIIACYGFPTMPFSANSHVDADGLIDTIRQSSGAITPGLFNTFPAGYQQKINDGHNRLSPDSKIDASTCLLPDQTWFIRGQLHFSGNLGALRDAILRTPGNPTVHNVEGYPQFLSAVSDGVFVPNEPVPAAGKPTFLGSLWAFTAALGKMARASITG